SACECRQRVDQRLRGRLPSTPHLPARRVRWSRDLRKLRLHTASRTSFGPDFGRSAHPRLLRNAPHTWNVSPTYDRGRVSIRVGLSYNAANIAAYGFTDGAPGGITGPFGDNYFYAHLQVDAQGSVRMARGLSFVMYGLNLNNEVFGFYNGSPQFMVQREFYKPTVAAGFRWSPLHER